MVSLRDVLDLARSWSLPLDLFHRHHVCQLYTSGHDHLAETVNLLGYFICELIWLFCDNFFIIKIV